MIKCYMFDLDGTLLNTLTTITYYINLTLQKYSILPITEQECKNFIGKGAKNLVDQTLKYRGKYSEELASEFYIEYMKAYDSSALYLTKPYDGIPELIEALRARGIKLAVISNKQEAATLSVIEHFFGDSFVCVRGGRAGVPLKPDSYIPREILCELGAAAEECVFVGDSEIDMQTGKNLGAALTVGVSWGYRSKDILLQSGADVIIDSPSDLLMKPANEEKRI